MLELLDLAVRRLRLGEVIAFPTESSYGLAADARSTLAVARLFDLKRRPPEKAPPLIIGSAAQIDTVFRGALPDRALALIAGFWPGALTLVLPAAAGLSPLVVADDCAAARVPAHPLARELALAYGGPLTATSANPSGAPPALSVDEVRAALGAHVFVLDGGVLPGGAPSTLVAFAEGHARILRQGAITLPEELLAGYNPT